MRHGIRGNCKFGTYHEMAIVHETPKFKVERCTICNKRFKWNKWNRGRVDNVEYLKAHVRAFAQPRGATNRVFQKLYHPENCKIVL